VSAVQSFWQGLPEYARLALNSTMWILIVTVALILSVAFTTLLERKVIGWMQLRKGPNRVGSIFGFLPGIFQPFADVIKLLVKEIVIPAQANKVLFIIAPAITLIPAFALWAVIPLSPDLVIADIDAGLLYVLSLTSVGVYGVIIAGWASNSKYAFLGSMRSAAQIVAYEIAMGFALVGVLMVSGSLNLGDIVRAQSGGFGSWNWFWLFPLFVVYLISGVAETNRAPFDVAEGESEIVAGFHVEYLRHGLRAVLPRRIREHDPDLGAHGRVLLRRLAQPVRWVYSRPTTGSRSRASSGCSSSCSPACSAFLWFRATFPRYRYDQIMRLGWKVLIPVTIVWIAVEGVMAWFKVGPWRSESSYGTVQSSQDLPAHRIAHGPVGHGPHAVSQEGHDQLSGREDAPVAAVPWPACAASLCERRRALHRLQAL
jgi:NADH-quinone oxidoreductase subunit H